VNATISTDKDNKKYRHHDGRRRQGQRQEGCRQLIIVPDSVSPGSRTGAFFYFPWESAC